MSSETTSGTAIRAMRRERQMTQDQLAARSGVTSKTISRIEMGLAVPHPLTLKAVADALGCSPDDLKERS